MPLGFMGFHDASQQVAAVLYGLADSMAQVPNCGRPNHLRPDDHRDRNSAWRNPPNARGGPHEAGLPQTPVNGEIEANTLLTQSEKPFSNNSKNHSHLSTRAAASLQFSPHAESSRPTMLTNSLRCHTCKKAARKSFPCHTSKKAGGWPRLLLTAITHLTDAGRQRSISAQRCLLASPTSYET